MIQLINADNSEERSKYIELFEGSKTKKEFFNLITKKRKEVDYWNTVRDQLKNNEILMVVV